MNKLTALLGPALLASLLAGGYALAQGTFAIAPVSASLALQQDGTCRGHLTYAIALTDDTIAEDAGLEQGTIEVKAPCARLNAIANLETFDDKAGKLAVAVKGVGVAVATTDPDGECVPEPVGAGFDGDGCLSGGPRLAGECDVSVVAAVTVADANARKVFRTAREITKTRPAPKCAPLTTLIDSSCWVARGAWPVDAPFPSIPKCP